MAVSKRVRYEVLRRDNYTCRYCGAFAPLAVLEVDHVMPRSRGGRDTLENLVTACKDCNGGKSAVLPEDWLRGEIERAAQQWRDDSDDEDDYSDMYAYQDALYYLLTLSADRVLHFMAQAYIKVMPYRPTHSEQIQLAAKLAREAGRVDHLWRASGVSNPSSGMTGSSPSEPAGTPVCSTSRYGISPTSTDA